MRGLLIVWFAGVIGILLWATVAASVGENVVAAARRLWDDPWGRATLLDAYFGFAVVYLWMAWREPTWPRRLLWAVLVATLGNFAISGYILIALGRRRTGDLRNDLFRRLEAA